MQFHVVANYLQRIEEESSRTVITQLLAELFAQADADEACFIAYFCLGELYPPYENKQLNIADKSVMRAFARLIGEDFSVIADKVKKAGDIGLYAHAAMLSLRGGVEECTNCLNVIEIRDRLQALGQVVGSGSQEEKEQYLAALFSGGAPLAVKFIVRSIVGTLRLGFSDMTMLDAYSWMAAGDKSLRPLFEHAYNVSADIGLVISRFKSSGSAGLYAAPITPGIPVRPAAAERLVDAQAIVDRLGLCVAQPKLDGFRVQVHVWTDEQGERQVRFFSRNLHDMSAMFPDLATLVAQIPADSLVVEGEAIAHDAATGRFLPFQETVKRKRKHKVDELAEQLPLTLYLFDVLYHNGQSQLAVAHSQRRALLQQIMQTQKLGGRVVLIEELVIHNGEQLSDYFDLAMSEGLEGIVVKKPEAPYQPGKRNFNWIKLKRQESGHLGDTIDCVILGYYAGQGKRTAFGIGALLVGIYDPVQDCFQTIAKIGTGLTDEEWCRYKQMADALVVTHQPVNVVCEKGLRPDVWVAPTIVCMIRADDITRSPVHTAGKQGSLPGYALRFPRIMGSRPDKDATQTTSPAEIEQLYGLQNLKSR